MKPVALFLLALIAVAAAQTGCPLPFELVGDKCYHISKTMMTRQEAEDECTKLAPTGNTAALAVLNDCAHQAILWQHITEKTNYWIGASDEVEEGNWRWSTGDEVLHGIPFWFPGQPNGGTDENFLSLSKNGYFADEAGTVRQGYICQLM
ncbi:CD209 antigen-like protein C [Penaeus japonicus]|uniref:CD209 antigen-like protein C n=1 Tax=Penaeus japonicus TaxID=27405 RepID=UPI001C710A6E|nr:CD209 antigen-like protein C [Penaeus japonicus]